MPSSKVGIGDAIAGQQPPQLTPFGFHSIRYRSSSSAMPCPIRELMQHIPLLALNEDGTVISFSLPCA